MVFMINVKLKYIHNGCSRRLIMKGYGMKEILANMEEVIIGKRQMIELLLIALVCEGHVLIEDVPGVGKTSVVAALAKSVQSEFKRIQFTPDVLPSDITGFSIYNQKTGEFEYKPGAIMSQFVLADEINRTSPKTQASLLEVMEEGQVTVDGVTYQMPKPFMILATQNPVEYLGTFPLPEAQMDRFFMRLSMGYPSFEEEQEILARFRGVHPLKNLGAVISREQILEMQREVEDVYVDRSINKLIVTIVAATRRHPDIVLGASPRGSLSLLRAAQGNAYYEERSFVLPEDVVKMAPYVLAHRLQLKHEAKLKKATGEQVISQIIKDVKVEKVDGYGKK